VSLINPGADAQLIRTIAFVAQTATITYNSSRTDHVISDAMIFPYYAVIIAT